MIKFYRSFILKGKANYGAVCDRDSDCGGFGVQCNIGKCVCNENYAEQLDKDSNTKYCVKCM